MLPTLTPDSVLPNTQAAEKKVDSIDTQPPALCERVMLSEDSWVEVVDSAHGLTAYQKQWEELAEQVKEPNVFHEYWMIQASLKYASLSSNYRFVFAFQRNKRETDPPILCGVFPLEIETESVFRLSKLKLLTNIYSYLATPLLHPKFQHEAITSLFLWSQKARFSLLEFPRIQTQGPFYQATIDVLNQMNVSPFIIEQHNRALLERSSSAQEYQLSNLSGHSRRDHRRLRRRLQEQGKLEFRTLDRKSVV